MTRYRVSRYVNIASFEISRSVLYRDLMAINRIRSLSPKKKKFDPRQGKNVEKNLF